MQYKKKNYVGQEVLDFVATQFGVVGNLTLGGGLTKMSLKGGRVFMKGLTSPGGGAPTWGEMISAAVYDMILRMQEDELDGAAAKADREVPTWLGKARKEMTEVEQKLSDKKLSIPGRKTRGSIWLRHMWQLKWQVKPSFSTRHQATGQNFLSGWGNR